MQRLDQLLASLGYGSRREVREWIEKGRVTVRGKPVSDPGLRVRPVEVHIDGQALDHPSELLLLLNKPAGFVCSHDPAEGPSVYSLLPERWRARNPPVTSVGRLDKDTTGLLLLTDNGAIVHRLTSPKNKIIKVYHVTLDREPPEGIEKVFMEGTLVLKGENTACAPAPLRRLAPKEAEVILTEGRYHQVKRMFASQGCEVIALDRVRMGSLEMGNLARGEWIELPINVLDTF